MSWSFSLVSWKNGAGEPLLRVSWNMLFTESLLRSDPATRKPVLRPEPLGERYNRRAINMLCDVDIGAFA